MVQPIFAPSHGPPHRALTFPHASAADMPQDGPQLGQPKTAKVFNDNFFKDFRTLLGADSPIVKMSLCDFGVSGSSARRVLLG